MRVYNDTEVFHFHNANPKGKRTTDCVTRALSTALEIPYETVVRELAELQIKTGYDSADSTLYGKYLKSKGWVKHRQPRCYDNTKYTGKAFCCEIRAGYGGNFPELEYQRIIAHIGGHHIVAIVNGKVWDTWDSTDGCIGNYWVKGSNNVL